MYGVRVIVLCAVHVQTHTSKLEGANFTGNMRGSMCNVAEDLADKLINKLFDKALKAFSLQTTDLNDSTLQKPAHLGMPQRASMLNPSYFPSPSFRPLHRPVPESPMLPWAPHHGQFRWEAAAGCNTWRRFSHPNGISPTLFTSSIEQAEQTEQWTVNNVRSTFIDFYKNKVHNFVKSSPCAPLDDPTLLFINAGMNQFKPVFLGQVEPGTAFDGMKRAVNSQKCIRAGGKHNDLEDVGRDTYHHTFFEMLGTWSFGDYFKQESIDWAWELLTDKYGLQKDRLYATYFEGNDQVPADTEARDFWLKYLPEDRVIASSYKDNFWEMGETGPCGPCSEVHYDRIGGRNAVDLVNKDDPDVIEIWNHVFMQFNRDAERGLIPLPQKHIDTGMGLERLTSILQQKSSNYDTDAFAPLFDKIATHSKIGPYQGKVGADDVDLRDTAYRAIADHARTLCFAVADGAVPNNVGRGYVLRRILRRAARYGQQILKADPNFFATLVPVVVQMFGEAYPELVQKQAEITEVIQEEEQAFSTMLARGIKFFGELEKEMKQAGKTEVAGDRAFFLYDTLGFPIDLTQLMAEEAGMTVDTAGFAKEMEVQKERSKADRKAARPGGAAQLELVAEQTAWLAAEGILPTDDSSKFKWDIQVPAAVLAVFGQDGFVNAGSKVGEGESVGLILDKSSFYAEGGGQVADLGSIEILDADGSMAGRFKVTDVQAYGGFLLHSGVVEAGSVEVGQIVTCKVDYERRRRIAPNHSMTHVLNAALKQVLGDGKDQRGSLVTDEKLRFDFSHKKAMTPAELRATEELCQKAIADAEPVSDVTLPLKEAMAIEGVRAVFGETYPDPVRVVSIGDGIQGRMSCGLSSTEFCGGTHLGNMGDAEAFVIVEEAAVAKGIRRITAITKEPAKKALAEGANLRAMVDEAEGKDAATPDLGKQTVAIRKDLDAALVSSALKAELRDRIEKINKKVMDVKKTALAQRLESCLDETTKEVEAALASDKKFLVLNVDIGADSKASIQVVNAVQNLAPEMAFLGVTEEEPGSGGKLMVFSVVPKTQVEGGFKADDWIRATLEPCGGRGGGRPNMAQGQAKDCQDVSGVVAAAKKFADAKVS